MRDSIRAIITGFLLVFILFLLKEILVEPVHFLYAAVLSVLAIFLAKKTAHHFHEGHTHAGDSALDGIAITVLFLANILHPAVDGFSFYETLVREGIAAGTLLGLSVIVHEVFRQSALVTAFKAMGIKWYLVVCTAVFGIVLGIVGGLYGSTLVERYETAIDLATLFAYVFIISEFTYSDHEMKGKNKILFVGIGIALGVALSVFFGAH